MVNDEAISEFLCSFYLKGLGDCIVADDSDDDDGSLPSFLIFYVDHSFQSEFNDLIDGRQSYL